MKIILITLTLFTNSLSSFGKNSSGVEQIKDILIKDKLLIEKDKKIISELKEEVEKEKKKKFENQPVTEVEFWDLITHLWLVKRENKLKWDFEKVDYGVSGVFERLLSKLNITGKGYKILYLNSINIPHMGLSTGNEYILLISKPFIERLDLSKQEISLLLLEEYLRLKMNTLMNKINTKLNIIASNKEKKQSDLFDKYLAVLDESIFIKGFSFQDQYNLTKEVVSHLKNDPSIAGLYGRLNDKIKKLLESDQTLSSYAKIYPSPELREAWLAKLLPIKSF